MNFTLIHVRLERNNFSCSNFCSCLIHVTELALSENLNGNHVRLLELLFQIILFLNLFSMCIQFM